MKRIFSLLATWALIWLAQPARADNTVPQPSSFSINGLPVNFAGNFPVPPPPPPQLQQPPPQFEIPANLVTAEEFLCGMVLISLAAIIFAPALKSKGLLAMHFLTVLLGMLAIIILTHPTNALTGTFGFITFVSMFKLMTSFEKSTPPKE